MKWATSLHGLQRRWPMTLVAMLSAAICVTMFALGFGYLIPISSAAGGLADMAGIVSAMVLLGLLCG
jgi:ABC-type multidrug transport system permease subunit